MAVPGPGWPKGSVDPRVSSQQQGAAGANGLIGQVPPPPLMPCQGPGNPTNPGDFAALGCNPKSLPVANATNVTVNVFNQPMSQTMLAALQQILGGNFPMAGAGTDGLGQPKAIPAAAMAPVAPTAPPPPAPPAPPAPEAQQAPPAPPAPGVLQAAPVISRAMAKSQGAGSTSKTQSENANRPAKSQLVGSLLSAYDDHDDESDMEDAEPAGTEATAVDAAGAAVPTVATVATVESRSWSNWEDMSDPRCRHGIVMGKQPEELVSAWPRDLSQYPPGYPPAQPPGCCTQRCHCMDGTKRPQQWEVKKDWLDDDSEEAKARAQSAQKCVEALSTQSFCSRRGRVSKQHFLEPQGDAATREPEARSVLNELSKQLAEALRQAVASLPRSQMVDGFPIPVRSLLLAAGLGADYAPLRIRALSEAVRIRFDPIGARVLPQGLAAGALLRLQVVLPEGEVALDVGRLQDQPSDMNTLSRSVGSAIARLRDVSPPSVRDCLMQGFEEVWDSQRGALREALPITHVLEVLERLRRMASSAAVAQLGLTAVAKPEVLQGDVDVQPIHGAMPVPPVLAEMWKDGMPQDPTFPAGFPPGFPPAFPPGFPPGFPGFGFPGAFPMRPFLDPQPELDTPPAPLTTSKTATKAPPWLNATLPPPPKSTPVQIPDWALQ